jgi:dTDP-4-dehydrorhamnose reductase
MSNVIGTLNYLEAARHNGVGRFVFASSGGTTIGEAEPPIHEEMVPHPVSPYGASKLAGEGYCSAYYRTFGIDTVALRFGNVYGPLSGHKNSVVARFIKRATSGEVLEIYGDGTQTRDFVFVGDLISAIRLAATVDGVGGEVFQIATSAETTVQELTQKLLPALAAAGVKDVEVRNTEERRGEVRRNYADTSKAERMLGNVERRLRGGGGQSAEGEGEGDALEQAGDGQRHARGTDWQPDQPAERGEPGAPQREQRLAQRLCEQVEGREQRERHEHAAGSVESLAGEEPDAPLAESPRAPDHHDADQADDARGPGHEAIECPLALRREHAARVGQERADGGADHVLRHSREDQRSAEHADLRASAAEQAQEHWPAVHEYLGEGDA